MPSLLLLFTALALSPVIGGGFGELSSSILEILVFAAVAAYALSVGANRGRWPQAPGVAAIGAFAVVFCLSIVFTESIYPSLRQLLFFSACAGAYVLAASLCMDTRAAAAMLWGLMLSAMGVCLFGIRDYAIAAGGGARFWHSLSAAGESARLFGTFVSPGFFAGFLVVALPVTLGLYLATRKGVLALVAGVALAVETAALMLTGTKFAIIAVAVAFLIMFALALATRSLGRRQLARLAVIAVVMTPLLILFSGPLRSRVVAAEAGGSQVHSTQFRVYTWKATAHMMAAHPWVGVGPGVFEIAYPRYTIAGPTKQAHQGYLQVASESGVLALAAMLAAMLAIGWRSLAGIARWREATRTDNEPVGDAITWEDLLPSGARRLMCCAVFAALAGSAIRNLADSDWYLMGIALPVSVLAGVMVAQSGAVKESGTMARPAKAGILVICVILALAAVSCGLGDYFAPLDLAFGKHEAMDVCNRYRIASVVSPLNARYHREYAKCEAAIDTTVAVGEADTAIRLAPTDAGNYFTRASIAVAMDEPRTAITYFNKALEYNPKSTQLFYQLALAYRAAGDKRGYESTLKRLLKIENSDHERIKGVPEAIDTTFAYAHAYFGQDYLAGKDYARAVAELGLATKRLERWRGSGQMLEVARFTGSLTPEEERRNLEILGDSYMGLAQAYAGLGDARKAEEAGEKAEGVKTR